MENSNDTIKFLPNEFGEEEPYSLTHLTKFSRAKEQILHLKFHTLWRHIKRAIRYRKK